MFKALDKLGVSAYYSETNSNDNIIDICVQFGLTIMAKGGNAITRDNTRWANVLKRFHLTCMAIIIIGVIMAVTDNSTTFTDFIDLSKTFGALTEALGRYMVILYYKTPLIQLINDSLLFWRIEDLSDKEKAKYLNFYQLQNRILQIFIICAALAVLYLCIEPLMGYLPLFTWTPSDNRITFWVVSIIDINFIYHCALLTFGFDVLFVSICNNVTIQFKLLQARIAEVDYGQLNVDEMNRKITDLIHYHIFLLKYTETIQKSFISFFLVQYSLTVVVSCGLIAASLIEDLRLVDVIEATTILTVLEIQFALYCIPLTEITTEARNVGDAVFHSEWYQGLGSGHKAKLLFMLMRAQMDCEFTAGGFVKMNREAIINILRLSLSVLTFFKTMNKK